MRRPARSELPTPVPVTDVRELERLSDREREVLALAAGGYLDKQIAAVLGITANTLRTYWTRIRKKLGEASRGALVALHARSEATASALNPIDGASWHIDVARNVLVFYGERELYPKGEIALEDALAMYHPDDREKTRALLRATIDLDMPPFSYAARVITPNGVETASAYVEAVHDASGNVTRIVGRHVPLLNLSTSDLRVGSYRRDLRTGAITVDEGYRRIFGIADGREDLLEAIFARLCPEHQELARGFAAAMIAKGETRRLATVRLCPNDGADGWVSLQVSIEWEDGEPRAVRSTALAYR